MKMTITLNDAYVHTYVRSYQTLYVYPGWMRLLPVSSSSLRIATQSVPDTSMKSGKDPIHKGWRDSIMS